MISKSKLSGGIPISTSLQAELDAAYHTSKGHTGKKRILVISVWAVLIAALVSGIARFLVYLINLVTNISFYGTFSIAPASPLHNHLGPWVIALPAIGGIIVGLMALYGSRAIRGHGIPEAMEQILTNDSKIKPTITYLKPLSSAIAIGTGGPFGAEGPIIATGGALGSTIGQLLRISHQERKVLLTAGATAGMAAIFGSPVAGIFLAIELLLFEFSADSLIPVALACITGAAGHYFFFEAGPVFPVAHTIAAPSNMALFIYSIIGLIIGLLSVGVTRLVYYLEDLFEHLPIHWMWWPAIGGLFVGVIGYFDPRTLGVGYNNITDVLSGTMPLQLILMLCLLKFASWSVSLSSGTSGGTLAPLLTIGGAAGAIIGMAAQHLAPAAGISLPLAAMVGMSALFAGASRALITSIIFALETTGQVNALLPLLAACTVSYFISYYLMENTIMTEKIARRGVRTPVSYKPDILEQYTVASFLHDDGLIINENNTVGETQSWLAANAGFSANYFVIADDEGKFTGIVSSSSLQGEQQDPSQPVSALVKRRNISLQMADTLKTAVETMVDQDVDVLPVLNNENAVAGILHYRDVLNAYKRTMDQQVQGRPHIPLKRKTLKLLVRGQHLVTVEKNK